MMSSTSVAIAVRPYVIAVISTGSATWLRSLLDPFLGTECPFSLYYLSVLLTAWLAGTYPAIVSLLLGTLFAAHFFIPPAASIYISDPSDVVNAAIYVFVNCVAIGLFAATDRQRIMAERRLQENEQLSASLKKADERKDEFLALLAHELRNPLAPIRSNLVLLERKENCPETIQRVRIVCQRQIHQLVRLVDDLLDISRFLRGSLRLQIERVDLRDAINAAIEMNEEAMQHKSHRFDTLMPAHPVWVSGDPIRLTQLTANLLGNAAKYTPNAGRILLQLDVEDGNGVIVVSDNGIGFPPGECERILEPFTQMDTSRTREYGGLGVGLSIVRQLVELHGGTLRPESRGPGSGSRFTVTIPITAVDDPAPRSEDQNVNSIDDSSAQGDDHAFIESTLEDGIGANAEPISESSIGPVLIVEDNLDAADALCELMQLEGIEVRVANDAIAALKSLEISVPKVILMDIGLPGIDGYQLTQRIRHRWPNHAIRIIACTGWGGEDDRVSSRSAGFDHHLVKPVNFTDLMQLLESHAIAGETMSA
jgi:two-component system CheB/CheR fusion protein